MQTQPSPANTEPIYLSRTSEAPAEGSPGHRPSTRTLDLNAAEQAVVGHMRGWCHDASACQLCASADKVIRMEAHVRTANARRINADTATAQIARDLIEAEHRADMAEARLDSIISG